MTNTQGETDFLTTIDGTVPTDKRQSFGTVDPLRGSMKVPLTTRPVIIFAHSTEKCAWCRLLK
jgi:hypothetical protein